LLNGFIHRFDQRGSTRARSEILQDFVRAFHLPCRSNALETYEDHSRSIVTIGVGASANVEREANFARHDICCAWQDFEATDRCDQIVRPCLGNSFSL
jgi:hypothetical protein